MSKAVLVLNPPQPVYGPFVPVIAMGRGQKNREGGLGTARRRFNEPPIRKDTKVHVSKRPKEKDGTGGRLAPTFLA